MSFSSLHKLIAYLLAGLGLWALSLGAEMSPISMLLLIAGFLASYFVEPKPERAARSARFWNVALLMLVAVQIARGVVGESIFTLALEFVAALQVSRLFNRRGAREYQQIAVLALLHLIAGTVLSTELSYAVIFLAFVVVTPWMLALSHLRREIEGNYPDERTTPNKDGKSVTNVARVLASRRVVGSSFLSGTALLSVPIFMMTGALFILFPRVGLGFLSFGRGRGESIAGFSTQVELGRFGVIRSNSQVVLRLSPPRASGARRPAALNLHVRGTTFDHYDGRSWKRNFADVVPRRATETFPIIRWPEPSDNAWSVSLEALRDPIVFLLPDTAAITVPTRSASGIARSRDIRIASDFEVRYEDADDLGLLYTAHVSPTPIAYPENEGDHSLYLGLPPHNERVVALARSIVGVATTPGDKAARILHYLRDSGRYRYTLQQPDVGNEAPLDVFLFRTHAGHCEYFATAMAILLRAVDVPTRNVAGFLGGHYNPYGDYYVLRQGDAHSWVEVLIPETGWQSYDPTPPSREAFGPEEGLFSSVRAIVDALRARWNERVVSYDLGAQLAFFRKLSRMFSSGRDHSGERGLARDSDEARTRWSKPALYVVVSVFALGLAFVVARYMRTRKNTSNASAPSQLLARDQASALSLYQDLESALLELGHARPPSITPREHASALRAQHFVSIETVDAITEAYVHARFGDAPIAAATLNELRAKLRVLRAENRRSR